MNSFLCLDLGVDSSSLSTCNSKCQYSAFLLIRIKLTQLLRSLATIITKCFLLTLLNKGKGEDNRKGRGCEEGEGGGGKGSLDVSGETPHLPFP